MIEKCASIDWTATGTMFQGIGTLVGAIAVIIAAVIGSATFEKWRAQKIAERRMEQAERILTAAYKARRGLSLIRSPMIWNHELEAAAEQLKTSGEWEKVFPESQRAKLATKQAYYNRLSQTNDEQIALSEAQPMARAFFGEALESAIEELNKQ